MMKRILATGTFLALWSPVSCNGKVDLGGKNDSNDAGEGGMNDGSGSGGASAGAGATSGRSQGGAPSSGGRDDGGDAGTGSGGSGADGGTGGRTAGGGVAGSAGMSGSPGAAGVGGVSGNSAVGGAGVGGAGPLGGGTHCAGYAGDGPVGCPLCGSFASNELVETCVLGSDGMLATTPFAASVTVVSVTEVDAGTTANACRGTGVTLTSGTSTHVLVEAVDQRRWTLVLRMPNLPSDFAMSGEPFELSVFAEGRTSSSVTEFPDQTIQLRRGNDLVLFGAVATWASGIEGLGGSGVTVTEDNLCVTHDDAPPCSSILHLQTNVTIGASQAAFTPHQTQRVDEFSVTIGQVHRPFTAGLCSDTITAIQQVAGFRVPP